MLGLVSLCMDLSSELVHSLLPVYLVSVMGASVLWVGLIEGIAEGTALVVKGPSGFISDRLSKRKLPTVVGYGLAALCKFAFPLAATIQWIAAARIVDRIGKGIREAPRDALIAELTPESARGASYGLRQALDTLGAVGGPLLAIALMQQFAGDFRPVFWVAVGPALIAVALLVFGVREPRTQGAPVERGERMESFKLNVLGKPFWWIVVLGTTLTLARFSPAFLLLKGQDAGLTATWTPLVMVAMNTVYAAIAYPAGALADGGKQHWLLAAGLVALMASNLFLANAAHIALVFLGAALWGLHFGLTEGLMAKFVADASPAHLRATAFGVFHLICGIASVATNTLAGWIWKQYGSEWVFQTAAILAAFVLAGLWCWKRRRNHAES